MTSSNVSNLLIQVNSINVEMPDKKAVTSMNTPSFENTLKNATNPDVSKSNDSGSTQISDKKSLEVKNSKLQSSKDTTSVKSEDSSSEIDEEVVEKVNEVIEEVKNVIEENLNVSEEEIENAMEVLGLSAIDILNPQYLAQLVATLSGEEESINLVMSDEFKSILDTVTELTNQLFEETGISTLEFKEILIPINTQKDAPTDMLQQDIPDEIISDSKPEIITENTQKLASMVDEVSDNQNLNTKNHEVENDVQVQEPEKESKIQLVVEDNSSDGNTKKNSQQNAGFTNGKTETQKTINDVSDSTENHNIVNENAFVFTNAKVEAQFIPEQQIVTLPTGENVRADSIVNQLVDQARILNTTEATTMEMTLNPEGLGKIFVEVTQRGDEITAKIFTENDAVKQALESQMANLRFDLNQNSSVKITSVEVSVGTHEFEKNLEDDARNDERRQEQSEQPTKRSNNINLNNLDELSGLMSEEDMLIAQIMQENGNTLDFQA